MLPIYHDLLTLYGPQGWWPLTAYQGTNPTATGRMRGYHPGDYTFPRNDQERFEICLGAILTRGMAWHNAEQAVLHLYRARVLRPNGILRVSPERLKALIRPCGYFNQKARALTAFAAFYQDLAGSSPTREQLLTVWGIGDETADTILLYAYGVPTFVIDTYTRRIFGHLGLVHPTDPYSKLQGFLEAALPRETPCLQEYHALLVEHAKRYYRRHQPSRACPLLQKYQNLILCSPRLSTTAPVVHEPFPNNL